MARRGGKATDTAEGDNVVPFAPALADVLDNPQPAPDLAQEGDQAPFGGRDDEDEPDVRELPYGCPVRPLGMRGQDCWYLDVQGQIIRLAPRDHGKNNIIALFSPLVGLPMKYWPRWSEPKYEGRGEDRHLVVPSQIVGFKQDEASEALIGACGKAGLFDPIGRVRGRGAHLGSKSALIVHTGDKIMVADRRVDGSARAAEWHNPGVIGGFVYPADAAAPRPDPEPVGEKAGELLLGTLKTWNWKRPALDPMLLLGAIGQGYICGALDWRSHVFITGGAGTGKSTLNGKRNMLDQLYGRGAIRTGSASEAAARQLLQSKTIPIVFDEFEPSEFNAAKTTAMLELARVASSGDDMHKGGQDHQVAQFVIQSSFFFSAILMPQMKPQDRSRFAILELKPLPPGTPPLDLEKLKVPALGRALFRRMVDGWPRFAETLRLYREGLERRGHKKRGQDQYGTLLACADLLLYDHLPEPKLIDHWAGLCRAEDLAELVDSADEHDECLNHLATSQVQARGGDAREQISTWIQRAERDEYARGQALPGERPQMARERAQLEQIGLKLVNLRPTAAGKLGAIHYKRDADGYLAIANNHQGLAALFAPTRWARGIWAQALGRVDKAERLVKVKFGGRAEWATCVPLSAILSPQGEEEEA